MFGTFVIVFAALSVSAASAAEIETYDHVECKLVQSAYFEGRDLFLRNEKQVPPLRLEVYPVPNSDKDITIDNDECRGMKWYRLDLNRADHSFPLLGFMIHAHIHGSAPAAGRFVGPLDAYRIITCQRKDDTIISRKSISSVSSISMHLSWETPCSDINSTTFYYYVYDTSGDINGPFTLKLSTQRNMKRDASSCEEGDVRLVDGLEGRAEFCRHGSWGTICSLDYLWSDLDRLARVFCRQLGYPASGSLIRWANAYGGYPNKPVAVAVEYCGGNESRLVDCVLNMDIIIEYCDHSNDIGVLCKDVCENGTRLTYGSIPSEGLLEVCNDNNWASVCGLSWGSEETSVACRGLGYNGGGQLLTTYISGYNNGEVINIACTGSESTLMECIHATVTGSCSHSYDVKLSCMDLNSIGCQEGEVRLQDGRSPADGIVEVCLNSTWQTLCSRYASTSVSAESVICYQLGFTRNARQYTAITRGTGPVSTVSFQCNGTEPTLMHCSNYTHGDMSCNHNWDTAVMCEQVCPCESGAVQLIDGSSQYEAILEMCHRSVWTRICRPGVVDEGAAQVVCKQLGFSSSGAVVFEDSSVGAEMGVFEIHCNGNESSLTQCETVHSLHSSCLDTNLGVRCQDVPCMDGDIRLIGGQSELEGAVEICRSDIWGSICDRNWRYNEARVVCRQLGYSPLGARWYTSGYFGQTSAPIHLSQVHCTGSELSLLDCEYTEQDHLGCYDYRDAGVKCYFASAAECINGDIRLIGGQSESEGTVEICFNNTWGSICDSGWSHADAEVVCRQLGFPQFGVKSYSNSHFGQSEGPVFLSNVQCSGRESFLEDCTYSLAYEHSHYFCLHTDDAGVTCYSLSETCEEGDIQLVGGVTEMEGTVALCYHGTWRRVCANTQWDSLNAAVICRQLGFSPFGAHWASESYYQSDAGQAGSSIEYIGNVNCNGSESSILSCSYTAITSCSIRLYIDVICQGLSQSTNNTCENGAVRLEGAEGGLIEGRVEICTENVWTTICDQQWGQKDAQVVCRQLGFSEGIPLSAATFGEEMRSTFYHHFDCVGDESLLIDCPKQPFTSLSQCTDENVAVRCEVLRTSCGDGEIRLVSGQSELEGTVEICFNQTWGTICDTNWGVTEAAIVCQQLGFYAQWAIPHTSGYFGDSPAPQWLNNVQCSGNESLLLDCQHGEFGVANCHYGNDAGVRCLGPCTNGNVQLVNRESQQEGTVEICIDSLWHTFLVRYIHSYYFYDLYLASDETQEASVVCHQLGFSRTGATVNQFQYQYWWDDMNLLHSSQVVLCNGTESSLNECQTPYEHYGPIDCPWDNDYQQYLYYYNYCLINGTNFFPWYNSQFYFYDQLFYLPFWIHCNETASQSDVVFCETGEVQLTGGETEYEGRVEICIDNTWARVCDPLWTDANAKAVCRQLRHNVEGATAVFWNTYSDTVRRPRSSLHFICDGIESSLLDCISYSSGSYYLSRDYLYDPSFGINSVCGLWEAGVLCQETYCNNGEVRLSHKKSALEGIVQICYTNLWGYVCGDYGWSDEEATVVCKQLGYSAYGSLAYTPSYLELFYEALIFKNFWMMQPKCSGIEASLVECGNSQLDHYRCSSYPKLVGVQCIARDAECQDGAVRLVGGRGSSEGRVEICYNRVWGMVCDDKWDSRDATVVCRQLGFSDVMPSGADVYFGVGEEPILLDDLCCNGNESSLLECLHAGVGVYNNCTTSNAATVRCTDRCPAQLEEPLTEGSVFTFNWTESEIGDVLHKPCPRECMDLVSASDGGEIRRRCGGTHTRGAHWEEVDLSQCGLSPIALQLCEATMLASTAEVAETVRTVTMNSDELGVPAVTVASSVISQLTTAAIEDEEVREDYLQSIDNLLQVNSSIIKDSQRQSNSSSRLLQSLADFSNNVPLPNSSKALKFTQKSYALRVADINTNSFAGETFSVGLGSVEEARNRSAVIDEDALQVTRGQEENTGATASVRVPMTTFSGTEEEKKTQRLTYTVFLEDTLFQSTDMSQENLTAGSIILAVRLNTTTTTPDTSNPLEASFLINELAENASNTVCGRWDPQANGGLGAWSTDSCTITREGESEGTAQYSQLGHFALLLDLTPSAGETVSPFALAIITYIGLVISLLCLGAFLITYLSSKTLRKSEHGQILMNLSGSLIGLYIIFLIAGHVAPVPALCGIAAALLQYFMLVFFGWTAAEAIYLYMKLVKVMGTGANIHRYVLKSALVVWFVPLLIVILSVGPGYKYYYKDDKSFCRAEEYPFWIGLIVPFGVIYIFNWVMFTLIMVSICKHTHEMEQNKMTRMRHDITIAIGMATLLGLGWGFGLLATSSDIKELTFTFQVIFSLFVGSQGLFLLALHGVRSSDARKEWKSWLSMATSKSTRLYNVARSSAGVALSTSSTYTMSTLTKGGTLPREASATKSHAE